MVTNGHTEAEGQHVTGEWVSGWRVRHLTLFPVNAETLPTATPPPQKKKKVYRILSMEALNSDWVRQSLAPVHLCLVTPFTFKTSK